MITYKNRIQLEYLNMDICLYYYGPSYKNDVILIYKTVSNSQLYFAKDKLVHDN